MGQTLKEKAILSRFRIGQPNDRGPKGANLNGPFSMKVEELLLCLITGSWQSYGSLRWQEVRGFTMTRMWFDISQPRSLVDHDADSTWGNSLYFQPVSSETGWRYIDQSLSSIW